MSKSDFKDPIQEIEEGQFISLTSKESEKMRREMNELDKLHKKMQNPKFKSKHQKFWIKYELMEAIISGRIQKGYTQKKFAKMIGVSQSKLKRIENGSCNIRLSMLKKIASGLGKQLHIEFR